MSYSQTFAIDAAPGLIKRAVAQAAITASAYIGTQHDQLVATATDMVLVVNIEAITTAGATGETYEFRIVGSNTTNRSDGEILDITKIGNVTSMGVGETRAAVAGDRLVMDFRSEKNRTKYRYIDLYLLVAGTSPSITFNAYLTKEAC